MKRIFAVVASLFFVAACTPQTNTDLPTLIPSPQIVATATSPAAQETLTIIPTEPPVARATLPPTWTPFVVPTETSLPPTETPLPVFTAIPTLLACGPFDIDREKSASTFNVGTPVQVFWTAVQGSSRYRISVLNAFNQEIFFDYALEAAYTFRADQFEAGELYAWRVYPEDSLLRQMCLAVTGELSPAS